jgi:hypothetical protein
MGQATRLPFLFAPTKKAAGNPLNAGGLVVPSFSPKQRTIQGYIMNFRQAN